MEIPKAWIEACAKAMYFEERVEDCERERAEKDNWFGETGHRHEYIRRATACLAAVFGRMDEVYYCERPTGYRVDTPHFDVHMSKGDTLVIVRGA